MVNLSVHGYSTGYYKSSCHCGESSGSLSGLKEPGALISVNVLGGVNVRYRVDDDGKVIELARYGGVRNEKEIPLVRKGRTKSLFNTGTRPHKSIKDYTRKVKYKRNISDDGE